MKSFTKVTIEAIVYEAARVFACLMISPIAGIGFWIVWTLLGLGESLDVAQPWDVLSVWQCSGITFLFIVLYRGINGMETEPIKY